MPGPDADRVHIKSIWARLRTTPGAAQRGRRGTAHTERVPEEHLEIAALDQKRRGDEYDDRGEREHEAAAVLDARRER